MTHLITPDDIVAQTVISVSTEPHKLAQAIPLAQGKHLRPLLGLPLFDELLAFAGTAPDLPATRDAAALAAYATARAAWLLAVELDPLFALLAEAKPMLCAWAVVEAWPSLLGHITPAGVVIKTGKSEGTSSADVTLAALMFSGIQETAIFRSAELGRWLARNRARYAGFLPTAPAPTGRLPIGGVCFA